LTCRPVSGMEHVFDIDIDRRERVTVLTVSGEVDLATAPLLDERLTEAIADGEATVIVNLDRVSFMDSTGLQVLIAHATPGRNGDRVRLTKGSAQVQKLFRVSGIHDRLPFVPDE